MLLIDDIPAGTITERSKFNFDLWLTAPIRRYRFAPLAFRWFWATVTGSGHFVSRDSASLFLPFLPLLPARFIRIALDSYSLRCVVDVSVIGQLANYSNTPSSLIRLIKLTVCWLTVFTSTVYIVISADKQLTIRAFSQKREKCFDGPDMYITF